MEWLNSHDARRLIRAILAEGTVRHSGHAKKRMKERKITAGEVLNTLKRGSIGNPELIDGTWRYPVDSYELCVTVALLSEKRAFRSDGLEATTMICSTCEGAMKSRIGEYQYSECGLDAVLHNVVLWTCDACGEIEADIPNIIGLHEALARTVATQTEMLTSREFRFLRIHLGCSGQRIAALLGVRPESVSRWENGATPIGATAERALRLMILAIEPKRNQGVEFLGSISSETCSISHLLNRSEDSWEPLAAMGG